MTSNSLNAKFSKVEDLVKNNNMSVTTACKELKYDPRLFMTDEFKDRRKALIELHRVRANKKENRKPKVNTQYVVPQKSPFRKEYRPIIRENNYLI